MPELPDLTVYVERLHELAGGRRLNRVRVLNPFVLRTAVPPIAEIEGCALRSVERLGKRIALGFDGGRWLTIHLMIAGRLRWLLPGAGLPGRIALAALEFDTGTLLLTEAGTQRRAAIHLLADRAALAALDRGGLEIADCTAAQWLQRLRGENHTLKRALTDPRLVAGIGNAYSDEILHRARLSPVMLTRALDEATALRLLEACREVLDAWTVRLRAEATRAGWPEKVTAFRAGMAVHGRFGEPCPDCGAPVQRIVHADNETNYCARCQTGGKLLADRALSRLLKASWPRHIDELG
jgi:formamidopyrimidine-DNA glycosylase